MFTTSIHLKVPLNPNQPTNHSLNIALFAYYVTGDGHQFNKRVADERLYDVTLAIKTPVTYKCINNDIELNLFSMLKIEAMCTSLKHFSYQPLFCSFIVLLQLRTS